MSDKINAKKEADPLPLSKRQMMSGAPYISPGNLRTMQHIQNVRNQENQRIAWGTLKNRLIGLINKVNASNITCILPELLKENIVRGRGILSQSILQLQATSPANTKVYAALVAIINSKFPEIGEIILKRLIIQYKRGLCENDKTLCNSSARFIAHLHNQEVAHAVLVLEMVTHLLENATADSVKVALLILIECGKKLTLFDAASTRAITQRLRVVLRSGTVSARIRCMIEVFFAVQKGSFKDFHIIPVELDFVEDDDRYTHLINLNDAVDSLDMLNFFKFDPDYLEKENSYKSFVKKILGDSSDEKDLEDGTSDEEEDDELKDQKIQQIADMTETNSIRLRRKLYLTIKSSTHLEKCADKLLKLELKPEQVREMSYIILDCCTQQLTYVEAYGLLAQRLCLQNKIYVEAFSEIFENSYKTIHRFDANTIRNVAMLFANLLYSDSISWIVLSIIKLNEDETNACSLLLIKILFQALSEFMGQSKLNARLKDATFREAFDGIFPLDELHNTQFAINFFDSIGVVGLTNELQNHLKMLEPYLSL